MGKRFWFAFLTLVVLIALVAYLRQSNSQPAKTIRNSIQTVVAPKFLTPTPMPFHELTIPYLRQQTYQSHLGSFEQVAKNQNYTSYLTSYLSDGLKINGLLTVPSGAMPKDGWPAIVFVHGYIPPKQYATLERYADYVDYLASNGFVVFKIDLRGNGESQGEPTGAYYSSGYVVDTLNAYAALQSAHEASPSATPGQSLVSINPNKIGLWGHSMAGNIVMRSWAVKRSIPAVVIWSGAGYTYTDLAKYKLHDPSFQPQPSSSDSATFRMRQQLQKIYGMPDLNNPFWHDLAPVSFLSEVTGAIQIDQAQDDEVVSPNYNRDLMKLLDKTSIQHSMYEYPTGGHNIDGTSFTQAMEHTVEFYKKYLE